MRLRLTNLSMGLSVQFTTLGCSGCEKPEQDRLEILPWFVGSMFSDRVGILVTKGLMASTADSVERE